MIHATAIIAKEAQIDSTVEIGPYCVVGPNVKLGKGTVLKSHVVIEGCTELGDENHVSSFAVLGGPPQDLKYNNENTKLVIGKNNRIREGVTINLGTTQGGGVTQLGDNNLLMSYVHVGHDCKIENSTVLSSGVGLSGHVHVEDYVIICGMSGVSQFVRLGEYTYVGGKSSISKDIPPYSIGYGSRPFQIKGANIIGLKRKGFSVEIIQKINEAIKLWIREDVQKEQAVLEIESQYGDVKEVNRLICFIRESKFGVAR